MEPLNLISKGPGSLLSWIYLAVFLSLTYFFVRRFGVFTLETAIQTVLGTFNSGGLWKGNHIPGPKWAFPNGQIADKFMNGRIASQEWRKKYGPVYRIWAGPHPEIVITTPQDLKKFHSDSDKHGKPLYSNLGWYIGQLLGRCLGLLEGEEWKKTRQIFEPAFKHTASIGRIDHAEAYAKKFVDNLTSQAGETDAKNDQDQARRNITLPVADSFMKFPFNLAADIIYGDLSDAEKDDLWVVTEKRLALTPYLFAGGLYRWEATTRFDRTAHDMLEGFKTHWQKFNQTIAEDRRARKIEAPIVSWWEEYESGKMPMEQFLQTLDEMLMTNLDVTTQVITWFITLLADHEDAQRELYDEIMLNKDNLQAYIASTNTHLHRCFYESLRLRPPLNFTAGESAPSVKDFHGVLVKPNTMVLVDVLAINVRNPFWGPNSEAYDPSRFLGLKQTDLRYNLIIFGPGTRKCLGQHIGSYLTKALVFHLFQQFEIRVVSGSKGANDYDLDKASWVSMGDITVQLTRREAPKP